MSGNVWSVMLPEGTQSLRLAELLQSTSIVSDSHACRQLVECGQQNQRHVRQCVECDATRGDTELTACRAVAVYLYCLRQSCMQAASGVWSAEPVVCQAVCGV